MSKSSITCGVLASLLALSGLASAQTRLPQPMESPKASVSQTIGVTDVTVNFHRPAVKGRTIWGQLVPYGKVWRAGANENTTITFQNPVKIEGKDLAAGTYGLHMLPTEATWTVIFSKNSTAWGSFTYKAEEDALRVTVAPVADMPFIEWLNYEFTSLQANSAVMSLRWDKLAVPVHIVVDTDKIVLDAARDAAQHDTADLGWEYWNSAAAYCLMHKTSLDEGLGFSERSVKANANFTNLTVQAQLLEALGRAKEAEPLHAKALTMATEEELNALGYQYLNAKQMKEALDTFKLNVTQHPQSWNAHDSLAEALATSGDKAGAIDHYKKALALVKDDAQRKRINGTLKDLGAN